MYILGNIIAIIVRKIVLFELDFISNSKLTKIYALNKTVAAVQSFFKVYYVLPMDNGHSQSVIVTLMGSLNTKPFVSYNVLNPYYEMGYCLYCIAKG